MLDVVGLTQDILQAQQSATESNSPEEARQKFAQAIALAIHKFVLTGTVVTVGGPTTQTGKMT